MNINILNEAELALLKQYISQSEHIVICCHKSPDGDALGSSLAWADYLEGQGKNPTVIIPDAYPDFLQWLPNTEKIVRYDKRAAEADRLWAEADLIFCLDFNTSSRVEDMQGVLDKSTAPKIMFDHHLSPSMETVLTVSHTEMCSTSEIVFRIIWQIGGFEQMSRRCAVDIYCGMMTDTGGFTYNSSRPEIYFIIGQLLITGLDKDKIYRNVYNNYSVDRLRLEGYILHDKLQFYANNRASIFTLTREEMQRFHFKRGDAEGIVNMPLQVKGMRLSISLREDTERDVIRVSLRSVDDFPCNKMAQTFFNGGGHLNASGGELACSLADAIKKAEEAIEAFSDLL